jgi:hypothetical protein
VFERDRNFPSYPAEGFLGTTFFGFGPIMPTTSYKFFQYLGVNRGFYSARVVTREHSPKVGIG